MTRKIKFKYIDELEFEIDHENIPDELFFVLADEIVPKINVRINSDNVVINYPESDVYISHSISKMFENYAQSIDWDDIPHADMDKYIASLKRFIKDINQLLIAFERKRSE